MLTTIQMSAATLASRVTVRAQATFTHDPAVPGVTPIKPRRTPRPGDDRRRRTPAIAALRTTTIRAAHLTELRAAVAALQ